MKTTDIDEPLRNCVWHKIITQQEAAIIQRMRNSGAVPFATVEADPSADPISEEAAQKMCDAIKVAAGVEKVLILPPGYRLAR